MKHVVHFSGGVGSWCAAMRVAATEGTSDMTLLFADTMMEDEDLYRFIDEGAEAVGVPITRIADGRTPWEVFFDVRYLGNTRADPCSRILKRELLDRWRNENCTPEDSIRYIGIDWSEQHRLRRLQDRCKPWRYEAPMCEKPYLTKQGMFTKLKRHGIKLPRLYEMGFPHNNCGGFCIKAGQGQFKLLLQEMPERYAFHESQEELIREKLGDVAILRDRTGGTTKSLTLREFRRRIECDDTKQLDLFEWGGCGCAIS